MRLSELNTGEKGIIVKVLGHGGFRKRILEMGFIRGKEVEVLLNAPLQDPVKYRIMGYEVSLRHNEAEMIEIIKAPLNPPLRGDDLSDSLCSTNIDGYSADESSPLRGGLRGAVINIALVGNPNCGKTSLFNFASGAHERVGNYSGVTVDAREGKATFDGYEFNIVDLPGTYSLTAYSPEELYVRKQIIDKTPDVIINVIDSSNLERNLYLTTQLIDMNIRMVCALNMYDEFEQRGDQLDTRVLERLLGVPMVPTSFKSGRGVDHLFRHIIKVYEDVDSVARHIHLNHGPMLEQCINEVKEKLSLEEGMRHKYSTRYLAIKLVEQDKEAERVVAPLPHGKEILDARDKQTKRILENLNEDPETALMHAKYGLIHGALQEAGYQEGTKNDIYQTTHLIDKVITNRYVGIPIFLLVLLLMFQVTFSLGQYPMDWIEEGVAWLGALVENTMADGPLKAMIVDGIIGGVGSVIVFLPQILILYAFISFMEDTGYMARAAFIMDKLMHKMGLHGKSFIPLIMGFGCNVPAVMATRTIESRRSRVVTMMILPLMSCSARLPIYIMITGTFFAVEYQSWIMISLYVIGILLSVAVSRIFCRFVFKGEDTPFVMEQPPYRMPTLKATLRHTWEKGYQYLKKMGGVILVASIIVWALGYFPHDENAPDDQQPQSYIETMGHVVEPVFRPCGFDWRLDVGLISGIGAKEIVASTVAVLYAVDEDVASDDDSEDRSDKYTEMRRKMEANGITPLSAFCFLLFTLIYFPCIATIAAIRSESGSWKWAIAAMIYTTALAWCVSAAVYQIGSLC